MRISWIAGALASLILCTHAFGDVYSDFNADVIDFNQSVADFNGNTLGLGDYDSAVTTFDNQITAFNLATNYGYPIRGALGTVEVINGRIGVSPPYQQEEETIDAATDTYDDAAEAFNDDQTGKATFDDAVDTYDAAVDAYNTATGGTLNDLPTVPDVSLAPLVPEPVSAAMLAGCGGIVLMRRRQRGT